ncbi:MAG: biopolymer transporter ExbD [Owenweeksia sp.]|nr:biopolymer transporter ExbD [Owenweeksia sp.]MBG00429.1 biopolymer transporter ExbD [Owenweeksia sp.]HBF20878.1 biopolymer transporter ExbD [Cryomorphaceae bacterium]HCQ15449.1 biopolymer transporter ExbD [Cryomorphaceae bacterium]|tara:strand:+ start:73 stop:465 length:393 start_codon:yes stop_codon:yes gene_type:complete
MDLKRRSKVSAEFSMSSMTDIVFLLLIFFMLASTLVTTSALDLVLPSSKAQTVKRKDVTVNISPDLRFSVGNQVVSEAELEREVLKQVQGKEDAVLILRADKSVPYEKVVAVMDIAYRNRLKMIAATDPK